MRTIDPILKSACQSGQGLFIASAQIGSFDYVQTFQTYEVLNYEVNGDNLTATLKGDAAPMRGMITISRGYEIGGTQYLESLHPFILTKAEQMNNGNYKISAKTGYSFYASIPSFVITINGSNTISDALRQVFYFYGTRGHALSIPQEGTAGSLFSKVISSFTIDDWNSDILKEVIPFPYVRIFKTETGLLLSSSPATTKNIDEISVIAKMEIRTFDMPIVYYSNYLGSTIFIDTGAVADSTHIKTILAFDYQTLSSPSFQTAMEQYYQERNNSALFTLLTDVSLEENDVFEYADYYWRIESINESFKDNWLQSLYCLRVREVPGNLLTEASDFLITEGADYLTTE